jgi:CheY-like chemotaxis protein
VLAVDDEPDNLSVIGDLLELAGAEVKRVRSGEEALAALATYRPTLVLLDLLMPDVDGWQVQRQMRQRPELNAVPIVALTALAMQTDKEKVLAAGFDGYITKPFRALEVLAALSGILKAKAAQPSPRGPQAGEA